MPYRWVVIGDGLLAQERQEFDASRRRHRPAVQRDVRVTVDGRSGQRQCQRRRSRTRDGRRLGNATQPLLRRLDDVRRRPLGRGVALLTLTRAPARLAASSTRASGTNDPSLRIVTSAGTYRRTLSSAASPETSLADAELAIPRLLVRRGDGAQVRRGPDRPAWRCEQIQQCTHHRTRARLSDVARNGAGCQVPKRAR